jgi:formate/nitrite transporter FocA (FNT family)
MADESEDKSEDKSEQKSDAEDQETKSEERAESLASPTGKIVYAAIRSEGEDELKRTTSALAWSGLAAGLSMGFSLVTQGLLHQHLNVFPGRPLLVSLGYAVGFLIVILGRQQLFTENTLTVILPLLVKRDGGTLRNVARLWTTVLLANLVGAALFAYAVARTNALNEGAREGMLRVAQAAFNGSFATTFVRGIFAGWLVAMMVWLLPFAETARVWVIIIITWLVGAASFSHVIAGAVEMFYLVFRGNISWLDCFGSFIIPAFLGNVVGGVSLVAAITHAQVVAGGGGQDL